MFYILKVALHCILQYTLYNHIRTHIVSLSKIHVLNVATDEILQGVMGNEFHNLEALPLNDLFPTVHNQKRGIINLI